MISLTELDTAARFAQLRQIADDLPVPSAVLSDLMGVLARPDRKWSLVESVVRSDPAVASNVLRLANSAAYRGRKASSTLGEACARIGERALMRTVIASSVSFMNEAHVDGYDIDDNGMWRHCVATALAAELLAGSSGLAIPEVAYTAGLVADVGKLLLGTLLASAGLDGDDDRAFDLVEMETCGASHATVSAWMLSRWGLPDEIVKAVQYHHRPTAEGGPLARVLHAADFVALVVSGGGGVDACRYSIDEEALASTGGHGLELVMLDLTAALTQARYLLQEEEPCPAC